MKTNDVEKLLGITRQALIHYEKEGLIQPERDDNNYRNYNEDDIERLKIILMFRSMEIGIDDIKLILDGKLSIKDVLENKKIHLENSKDNIEIIQERIKTYLERKKVYLFFDNEEKRNLDITSYFDTSPRYIEFYISDEKMSFENINILYEDVYSIDVSICVSKAENGLYYGIHNLYFIIVNINTKEYCHTLEIMNNNKINRFFDVIKEKDIKVNDPMG